MEAIRKTKNNRLLKGMEKAIHRRSISQDRSSMKFTPPDFVPPAPKRKGDTQDLSSIALEVVNDRGEKIEFV